MGSWGTAPCDRAHAKDECRLNTSVRIAGSQSTERRLHEREREKWLMMVERGKDDTEPSSSAKNSRLSPCQWPVSHTRGGDPSIQNPDQDQVVLQLFSGVLQHFASVPLVQN